MLSFGGTVVIIPTHLLLWWIYRTKTTLWSSYMGNKYCKKLHPVIAQSKGASTTWRIMIKIRELVEYQIWWQIKEGDSSFWFDNWTTQGALYYFSHETSQEEEIDVKEFADQQDWKVDKLKRWLSEDIVQHILKTIPSPTSDGILDRTWWMLEESRKFTVKSAWEYVRQRTVRQSRFLNMWEKRLPFKIFFFI
ncbi:hypothetical protein H5410_031238 [Solanum commersonii]|uniref:Uncharacterized protein n=1 Tax=Solanum commersonii TaxID=4109 RepID=A0A9J5YL38_SOLCO|nr:hypothetical protein H5410_031238 [Solanum commersonii]